MACAVAAIAVGLVFAVVLVAAAPAVALLACLLSASALVI